MTGRHGEGGAHRANVQYADAGRAAPSLAGVIFPYRVGVGAARGDGDPLGGILVLDGPPEQPHRARVVGVVESVHMHRRDAEKAGTLYIPMGQAREGVFPNWGMETVVRGASAAR